jgi:hypothetical protein
MRILLVFILSLFSFFSMAQAPQAEKQSCKQDQSQISNLAPVEHDAVTSIMSNSWKFTLYQLPSNPVLRNLKGVTEGWVSLIISNELGEKVATVRVVGTDGNGNNLLDYNQMIQPGDKLQIDSQNIRGIISSDVGPIEVTSDQPVKAFAYVGSLGDNSKKLINGEPEEVRVDLENAKTGIQMDLIQSLLVRPMVTSCCGYSSSGNPYPCGCTGTGNCTWWAWKSFKDYWGISLPGWGNAGTWASSARAAGYPVLSDPFVMSIAVHSAPGQAGHVCWVTQSTSTTVTCTEMNYCVSCQQSHTYSRAFFNEGFIYHP